MKYKNNLLYKLDEYGKDGLYPFHMPGHKRNDDISPHIDAYRSDITEIDGFDDLHHPDGCLKKAMERASLLFDTRQTFFLINGCTCGILAAIHGVLERGDDILLARNCHKSAYNAVSLLGLKVTYLWPDDVWDIPACIIDPDKVEDAFAANPNIKCVFITSPTYEGYTSDIRKIAAITHSHGALLIVDEAHGAHMSFGSIFPASAVSEGADIVIHGIHKTLPSLTQTALLHICSDRVDLLNVKRYLAIFQSSSPSYVLMGAIDYCMDFLINDGPGYFDSYKDNLHYFYEHSAGYKNISILPYSERRDASKIVIRPKDAIGSAIYGHLRKDYNLQPEMSLPHYVIMMTSVCDTRRDFDRLLAALFEIDAKYDTIMKEAGEVKMTGRLNVNEGDICRDMLYVYPPGIPIIVKGERYSRDILEKIDDYQKKGYIIKSNQG